MRSKTSRARVATPTGRTAVARLNCDSLATRVRSPSRIAAASPNRSSVARPRGPLVQRREHPVRGRQAATGVRGVHDVVVEEGGGLEQLERRADPEDRRRPPACPARRRARGRTSSRRRPAAACRRGSICSTASVSTALSGPSVVSTARSAATYSPRRASTRGRTCSTSTRAAAVRLTRAAYAAASRRPRAGGHRPSRSARRPGPARRRSAARPPRTGCRSTRRPARRGVPTVSVKPAAVRLARYSAATSGGRQRRRGVQAHRVRLARALRALGRPGRDEDLGVLRAPAGGSAGKPSASSPTAECSSGVGRTSAGSGSGESVGVPVPAPGASPEPAVPAVPVASAGPVASPTPAGSTRPARARRRARRPWSPVDATGSARLPGRERRRTGARDARCRRLRCGEGWAAPVHRIRRAARGRTPADGRWTPDGPAGRSTVGRARRGTRCPSGPDLGPGRWPRLAQVGRPRGSSSGAGAVPSADGHHDDPRARAARAARTAAVPAGVPPQDSAVAVALRPPRGRVGLIARVDLPDLAEPELGPALCRRLVTHLVGDGASRAVLVLYVAEDPRPWPPGDAPDGAVVGAVGPPDGDAPGTRREPEEPSSPTGRPTPTSRTTWPSRTPCEPSATSAGRPPASSATSRCGSSGQSGYLALDCLDPACCPPGGRPLARAAVDRGGRAHGAGGRHGGRLPGRASCRTGPPPPARVATRAGRRRARRRDGRRPRPAGAGRSRRGAPTRWPPGAPSSPRAVPGGPPPTDAGLGRLLTALDDVRVRDAVLLTLVAGSGDLPERSVEDRPAHDEPLGRAVADALAAIVSPRDGVPPDAGTLAGATALLEHVVGHARGCAAGAGAHAARAARVVARRRRPRRRPARARPACRPRPPARPAARGGADRRTGPGLGPASPLSRPAGPPAPRLRRSGGQALPGVPAGPRLAVRRRRRAPTPASGDPAGRSAGSPADPAAGPVRSTGGRPTPGSHGGAQRRTHDHRRRVPGNA